MAAHPAIHDLQTYCESRARWDSERVIEAHLVYCAECCRRVAQIVRVYTHAVQRRADDAVAAELNFPPPAT
jgi:hypothetical protein